MHKINFISSLVFETLVLIASLVQLKSHHQFVALIDMYLHAKNKFTPAIVFQIKFKNPAI